MSKINHFYHLIFFTFLISTTYLFSKQHYNKEYLKKQNYKLHNDIKILNTELLRIKKKSEQSILYFTQLNKKINKRSLLIENIIKEKDFIKNEIHARQIKINELTNQLNELYEEYSKVLIYAYKNKSIHNKILFILGSKNFHQAIRRLEYLKKYKFYQVNKLKNIKIKRNQIKEFINQKEQSKLDKEILLTILKKEIFTLNFEKKEKEKIIKEFKNYENNLLVKIKLKEQITLKLENDIKKAIQEEILLSRRDKSKLELKRKEKIKKSLSITKQFKELNNKKIEKLVTKQITQKFKKLSNNKIKKEVSIPVIISNKIEKHYDEKSKKTNKIISSEYNKNKELISLSENFSFNQRQLPWPVENGTIVSRFGKQIHPVLPNITINNTGIEFATSKGSNCHAVFSGEVFKIQSIPGGNIAIMLSHGDYFTIYTNLDHIYVEVGDKVHTKQILGKIYVDENGNSLTGFQIWKGIQKLDPALWLINL